VFVAVVYVVLVLGGGAVIGHTDSPHLGLSVLATAVVALAFDPVQSRLEALASRVVHGGLPAPYDVLRQFSETVTGSLPAEELPARMAHVLADGTGAQWAGVWLLVDGRPTLAAVWPLSARPEAAASTDESGRHSLPVLYGPELLGILVVQERPAVPLTTVERRLFEGLAGQAGRVLRGARLRAELERRLAELEGRAAELRASRERLVDAQDEERRLLERDIHDGAQQHLVALAVNLRLAEALARHSPDRAARLLADQQGAAVDAIETLHRMSRGIYPALLGDEGPAAALRADFESSPVPVELTVAGVGRYGPGVEATAYFCALEAVQNAVKHAGASRILVALRGDEESLELVVEDDGVGFDPATGGGSGLVNLRDRAESAGGVLAIEPVAGRGTRVRVSVPVGAGAQVGGG
jgi:signal transduction histidine kinase